MKHRSVATIAVFWTAVAMGQFKSSTYTPGQLVNIPGEAVVINTFGVYPTKISRNQGPFLLYILNRLPGHTEHFSLHLDQDNAPELTGLDTTNIKSHTSMLLDLKSGTYRVSFRNRKDLTFTIEIQ